MTTTMLKVGRVERCVGLQVRARIDTDLIKEYSAPLRADRDAHLPPIDVFEDGAGVFWLADGWHRLGAYCEAFRLEIPATVHKGSKREALSFALSANARHDTTGRARTQADRRRSVALALRDEEWKGWSNEEIARLCAVSEFLVREVKTAENEKATSIKSELPNQSQDNGLPLHNGETQSGNSGDTSPAALGAPSPPRVKYNRKGRTQTMRTGNIGRRQAAPGGGRAGRPPTFSQDMKEKIDRLATKELQKLLEYVRQRLASSA